MSTALTISDLRVTLGGNEILSGINAKIEEGEFIGIFGPNGAGKTTLVRAILGTLRPPRDRSKFSASRPAVRRTRSATCPREIPALNSPP
jgi:manganese/iron transport system ATP-binding protein